MRNLFSKLLRQSQWDFADEQVQGGFRRKKYVFHHCKNINKLCQKPEYWRKASRLSSCITLFTAIFIPDVEDLNQYWQYWLHSTFSETDLLRGVLSPHFCFICLPQLPQGHPCSIDVVEDAERCWMPCCSESWGSWKWATDQPDQPQPHLGHSQQVGPLGAPEYSSAQQLKWEIYHFLSLLTLLRHWHCPWLRHPAPGLAGTSSRSSVWLRRAHVHHGSS